MSGSGEEAGHGAQPALAWRQFHLRCIFRSSSACMHIWVHIVLTWWWHSWEGQSVLGPASLRAWVHACKCMLACPLQTRTNPPRCLCWHWWWRAHQGSAGPACCSPRRVPLPCLPSCPNPCTQPASRTCRWGFYGLRLLLLCVATSNGSLLHCCYLVIVIIGMYICPSLTHLSLAAAVGGQLPTRRWFILPWNAPLPPLSTQLRCALSRCHRATRPCPASTHSLG